MSLEDKANDGQSKGLIRKALKLGYSTAMAAATVPLAASVYGSTGVLIGAGLAAGHLIGHAIKGSKSLYTNVVDTLKTYATMNILITPVLKAWDWVIPMIPNASIYGKIARGVFASTAFNAFFETMYKGTKHLVDNYLNPVGIVKSIKNNFYNDWKRSAIGFSPGYTLAANGYSNIPFGYFGLPAIPTFAANALGLGMYDAIKPVPVKKENSAPSYGSPAASHAGAH